MHATRWICGLIGLMLLGSSLSAQTTTQFSDSFHSNTLDRSHWVVGRFNVRGEVTPTVEGLRLTLAMFNHGPFYALTVWLNCRIRGDFDAQVGYRLVDWPIANGIRLGLGVHPNPLPLGSTTLHGATGKASGLRTVISERISLQAGVVTTYPGGGEFYVAELNGRENRLFPTADRSGKMRVTRVQNDFTAWYWDRGGRLWVPTGRWSLNPQVKDDEWIALQLWGYKDNPAIAILFENFSVSAASLSCP